MSLKTMAICQPVLHPRSNSRTLSRNKYVLKIRLSTQTKSCIFHTNFIAEQDSFFKLIENKSLIKTSPNGISGIINGRFERFMRQVLPYISHYNECHRKEAIIHRIPKNNFNIEDQSTLRDISLLPVCYKVLSKDICNRIISITSNKIDFWQITFLFVFLNKEADKSL